MIEYVLNEMFTIKFKLRESDQEIFYGKILMFKIKFMSNKKYDPKI